MITSAAEYEYVAGHEAAHAAAAALLGVLPIGVEVGGQTDAAGRVWFQPVDMNRAVARRYMLILLAGQIGTDEDPVPWPPSEQALEGSDERKLGTLVRYLGLTRRTYRGMIREAWELAADREFRLLEHGFRTALSYRSALDAPLIAKVLFAVLEHEQVAALFGTAVRRKD